MMQSAARLAACHWIVKRHNNLHAAIRSIGNHQDFQKDSRTLQRNGFTRVPEQNAFPQLKAVLKFRECHAEKFTVHGSPRAGNSHTRQLICTTNDMDSPLIVYRKFNIRCSWTRNTKGSQTPQEGSEFRR